MKTLLANPDRSLKLLFLPLWLAVGGFDASAIMRHLDVTRPECCVVWPFIAIFSAALIVLPAYFRLIMNPPTWLVPSPVRTH